MKRSSPPPRAPSSRSSDPLYLLRPLFTAKRPSTSYAPLRGQVTLSTSCPLSSRSSDPLYLLPPLTGQAFLYPLRHLFTVKRSSTSYPLFTDSDSLPPTPLSPTLPPTPLFTLFANTNNTTHVAVLRRSTQVSSVWSPAAPAAPAVKQWSGCVPCDEGHDGGSVLGPSRHTKLCEKAAGVPPFLYCCSGHGGHLPHWRPPFLRPLARQGVKMVGWRYCAVAAHVSSLVL